MRKVLVATPAHSGDVCCDYAIAMMEVFRLAHERGYDIRARFWMYNSIVAEARNILLGIAYEEGFDDMVFIDADQGFSAEAFYRLLEHPVDVVGFPVRIKRLDSEVYNVMPNDDFSKYVTHPELRLINVPAIGTGMMRLSKVAIAALWHDSRKYRNYGVDIPHICQVAFDGGMLLSEDLYLCKKLKDLGFPIYVDPSYTADHFGRTKFSGSYAQHLVKAMTSKQ
jgi:hypothetical protein